MGETFAVERENASRRSEALTASGPCDYCIARAYVWVHRNGKFLQFCAHHWRDKEVMLGIAGFAIARDDRRELHSPC